jgi:hypothetical protein
MEFENSLNYWTTNCFFIRSLDVHLTTFDWMNNPANFSPEEEAFLCLIALKSLNFKKATAK